MATTPMLQVHQNYHPNCEAAVNNHINLGFHASDMYLSVAFYFDRDDAALEHFGRCFLRQLHKREHAQELMRPQNQHGGCICFHYIRKSERQDGEQAQGHEVRLAPGEERQPEPPGAAPADHGER